MKVRIGLAATTVLVALVAPAVAQADSVTLWNTHASEALFNTAGQAPPVSVSHLAMVHGAVYDAVNAIDGGREPYLITTRVGAPWDSQDAAVATAAYRVLLHLVPGQAPVLDAHYAASLAGVPDGSAKTRGIAVGNAAAAAMIAARTDDGRFGPFRFTVGMGIGVWRPVLPAFANDPNAWIKDVKPFLIDDPSRFGSDGPLSLTSKRYAREFAEVKSVGSATSTTRTDDQTHAARYWAENPPRTWSRIFRAISAQKGLSVTENARLFTMLYMTAADAFISVWTDKARWSFWRPVTAIAEAGADGNPATAPETGWAPLIANPPYPEHPSGHLGLSGSIGRTLQQFFRTDRIAFSDTNAAGLARSWTRISQAVGEIVGARIWSGIHFRTADEDGLRIGESIADYREKHYFGRVKAGDEDDDD